MKHIINTLLSLVAVGAIVTVFASQQTALSLTALTAMLGAALLLLIINPIKK